MWWAVPAQPVRVLLSGQRRAVHHRACNLAQANGVDFSPYVEEDGDLRDVFIFYAGYNNAERRAVICTLPECSFSDPNQSFGPGGAAVR